MENLINWKFYPPSSIIILFGVALLFSLIVRVIGLFFRTLELEGWDSPRCVKCRTFWIVFWGGGRITGDHWLAFILGYMELVAYPLLMLTNNPSFIGAWLVLKTAHRVGYAPKKERGHYNRYLVCNALILILSYVLARWIAHPGVIIIFLPPVQ